GAAFVAARGRPCRPARIPVPVQIRYRGRRSLSTLVLPSTYSAGLVRPLVLRIQSRHWPPFACRWPDAWPPCGRADLLACLRADAHRPPELSCTAAPDR